MDLRCDYLPSPQSLVYLSFPTAEEAGSRERIGRAGIEAQPWGRVGSFWPGIRGGREDGQLLKPKVVPERCVKHAISSDHWVRCVHVVVRG